MSDFSALEQQFRYLEEHGEGYRLAKETWADIPSDTKKALAKKWLLKAANFANHKAIEYAVDDQDKDRQRIIPLPAALNAIQNLEAELVRTQVLDLGDICWKRWIKMRELYRALHTSWSDVWNVIRALWSAISGPNADEIAAAVTELGAGLAACAAILGEVLSTKAFIATALSVMHERDKCVAELRRKAFPQIRHARRYRVRKRAR